MLSDYLRAYNCDVEQKAALRGRWRGKGKESLSDVRGSGGDCDVRSLGSGIFPRHDNFHRFERQVC